MKFEVKVKVQVKVKVEVNIKVKKNSSDILEFFVIEMNFNLCCDLPR